MCGCLGLSFGSSIGFGSGAFALTLGGGGGGGRTGTSVTGISKGTTEYFRVPRRSGKKMGAAKKKARARICAIALTPMRSQRFSPSGSNANRAGTGLVPMAVLHASFRVRGRFASKPTPRRVPLVGGSAVINGVIRVLPSRRFPSANTGFLGRPSFPSSLARNRSALAQEQSTNGAGAALIGPSYYRREVANGGLATGYKRVHPLEQPR